MGDAIYHEGRGYPISTCEYFLFNLIHRSKCLPTRSLNYVARFGQAEMYVRNRYKNYYKPGMTLLYNFDNNVVTF